MQTFYFGLVTAEGVQSPDEIGSEFDSLELAYIDGCRAILEISFDMLKERCDPHGMRFEITDAFGRLLMELPFAEVLAPRPSPAPPAGAGEDRLALARFRFQARERRRLARELADVVARTSSTMDETRALLARSRRQAEMAIGGRVRAGCAEDRAA